MFETIMGFDMQMIQTPTPAEIKIAALDADSHGYFRFNVHGMTVMVLTMLRARIPKRKRSLPPQNAQSSRWCEQRVT